jgi:glyoxylase-like metal-dependent hydrolase (beta-lactamase superfamily II)
MNDPRPSAAQPASTLTYPYAQPPAPGTWQQVAPGVFWIRMPLPFALDHINLWILRDGTRWTLIDTGINSETTRSLWDAIFAGQLQNQDVGRIVVTHFHPDHFGLAGWLTQRFDVQLWMTEAEYLTAHNAYARLPGNERAASLALFAQHGLDPDRQEALRQQKHAYPRAISEPPKQFVRMLDGDKLTIDGRAWEVIVGYGHAPEHAALYCSELSVLISGDMVLPKISTNVSVGPSEPDGDPLKLFLRSVDRYAQLPPDTLILPSHGLPFYGLQARAAALHEHHRMRLHEVLEACAQPMSAAEILPVLFRRSLDTHQLSFAMGEAVAHLNHLLYQGQAIRALESDKVLRFQRTS